MYCIISNVSWKLQKIVPDDKYFAIFIGWNETTV